MIIMKNLDKFNQPIFKSDRKLKLENFEKLEFTTGTYTRNNSNNEIL